MEQVLVIDSHSLSHADAEFLGMSHRLFVEVSGTSGYMPDGFFVTTQAMKAYVREHALATQLESLTKQWLRRAVSRSELETQITALFISRELSHEVVHEIHSSYMKLGRNRPVLLRISGDSTLTIQTVIGPLEGETNVVLAITRLWAAYVYEWVVRQNKKPSELSLASISVLELIEADFSGLIVTHGGKSHHLLIEAVAGSSEFDLHESVMPDRYELVKDSWHLHAFDKGRQEHRTIWKDQQVHHEKHLHSDEPHLNTGQLEEIAQMARRIENSLGYHVEIDWVLARKKIWIVNISKHKPSDILPALKRIVPIAQGEGVWAGIASGFLLDGRKKLEDSSAGAIVLLEKLTTESLSKLRHAKGAIIEQIDIEGKRLAKELGIPMVADLKIKKFSRRVVTIDGRSGQVYQGNLLSSGHKIIEPLLPMGSLPASPAPHAEIVTPIWGMNRTPVAKAAGIMWSLNDEIKALGVHPAFLETGGQGELLVEQIDKSITVVAHSMSPRPVLVQLSDMHSTEFSQLRYGSGYETTAALGLTGASRHEAYPELLNIEILGILRARHKHLQMNIWALIPGIQNHVQALSLKKHLASEGLVRSASFKLWMGIEHAGAWWNIAKILEIGIDGIVINWEAFLRSFWGIRAHTSDKAAFSEEIQQGFIEFLGCKSGELLSKKVSLFIRMESVVSVDIVKSLLSLGVAGFVFSTTIEDEMRKVVAQAEKR